MTEKEVFNEITSRLKWYIGYCSASYASQLKRKYKAGLVGREAINNLFKHYGYTIKTEAQWEKK